MTFARKAPSVSDNFHPPACFYWGRFPKTAAFSEKGAFIRKSLLSRNTQIDLRLSNHWSRTVIDSSRVGDLIGRHIGTIESKARGKSTYLNYSCHSLSVPPRHCCLQAVLRKEFSISITWHAWWGWHDIINFWKYSHMNTILLLYLFVWGGGYVEGCSFI